MGQVWWRYMVAGVLWLLILAILPFLLILALPLYLMWIRPWQLRWGASADEIQRTMPGDDIVQRPHFIATRGVTVHARPADIWPWIVQIGCLRAGWYSYDWVDNLGIPSAARILPELQHVKVGERIPFAPDGQAGMWVRAVSPHRWMLWVADQDESTWFWGLYPEGEGKTRLVTRLRVRYNWRFPWILFWMANDAGDIVMMRKCLLGIKRRAEQGSSRTYTFSLSRQDPARLA